jgi:hypothetical protein
MSRDIWLEHMENRSACCEYDEPEPIEEVEDRMQSALEAAYALFGVTTTNQIEDPRR